MIEKQPRKNEQQADRGAKVYSMGAYVALRLTEVDYDTANPDAMFHDDRIVRINNQYAERGMRLKKRQRVAKILPVIIDDRDLERMHHNAPGNRAIEK